MTDYVCTIPDLERVVGERPAAGGLKSIKFLDPHCDTLLALSTLSVVATFDPDGTPRTMAVGGPAGHATPETTTRLGLGRLDTTEVVENAPVGLLALVPGYRETLRINGRLRLDATPALDVEEAFLHCAKALIRSRLWDEHAMAGTDSETSTSGSSLDEVSAAFLARSPFIALSSMDAGGAADVSPKGDPAGFVHLLDDGRIAIPDRPGNRRTDTMHNLVDHPRLGVLAFVPGDPRTLELRGTARITDDPAVREPMAVQDKVPAAAIVVDVDHVDLRHDPAVEAAGLWDTSHHVDPATLPRGSRIWTDHVKLNDDPGLAAKAMRAAINEKMMRVGIDQDYKKNLY
jgi:PPOX class probable FMN-dependent enzyme